MDDYNHILFRVPVVDGLEDRYLKMYEDLISLLLVYCDVVIRIPPTITASVDFASGNTEIYCTVRLSTRPKKGDTGVKMHPDPGVEEQLATYAFKPEAVGENET